MESARCFGCIPKGAVGSVWLYLLCQWASVEVENPPPPCAEYIVNNGNGTVTIHWSNPIAYDSIEIIHTSLVGGSRHLEDTIPGNSVSWTTPILALGDYFLVQGVLGDDRSPFAVTSPCT